MKSLRRGRRLELLLLALRLRRCLLAAGKLFTNEKEAGFSAEGAKADEQEDTSEGAAEWATAEPEAEEFLQYVDWDRFEAKQGVEAAEQGVEAAGQGVAA